MKRYYSVKEASKLLNVSTNTIYKYLKEDKLVSKRIGKGRFKILYSSMAPYIDVSELNGGHKQERETGKHERITDDERELGQVHSKVGTERDVTVSKILQKEKGRINIVGGTSASEKNDAIFFRLFKAALLLGLGIIYLVTNVAFGFSDGFMSKDLGEFITFIFPLMLIVGGVVLLARIVFHQHLLQFGVWSHGFLALVLGYYSYIALSSGDHGLFVWTASFLAVVISHFARGLGVVSPNTNFSREFLRYSLFLAVIGGVVLVMYPFVFPVDIISSYIGQAKGVAAFIWFAVYIPVLIYLISPTGKNSIIRTPFFILSGLFAIWVATSYTFHSEWEIAYFSFLTGVYAIFLGVWVLVKQRIILKKYNYLVAASLWIASFIIFGIFAIQSSQKKLISNSKIVMQDDLTNTIFNINNTFEKHGSLITSTAGAETTATIVESKNSEQATEVAKKLYNELDNVQRIMVYDENGIALGVYPRNSLAEGTNFSSREYFQRTKNSYRGYISSVFETVLGTAAVTYTEPVFKDNRFVGMIGVGYTLDVLAPLFNKQSDTILKYEITAMDENGVYVYNPDASKIGTKGDLAALLNMKDMVSEEKLHELQAVPVTRWNVLYEVETSVVVERAANFNVFIGVVLLVNSIVSFMAAIVLASKEGQLFDKGNISNYPVSSGQRLQATSI